MSRDVPVHGFCSCDGLFTFSCLRHLFTDWGQSSCSQGTSCWTGTSINSTKLSLAIVRIDTFDKWATPLSLSLQNFCNLRPVNSVIRWSRSWGYTTVSRIFMQLCSNDSCIKALEKHWTLEKKTETLIRIKERFPLRSRACGQELSHRRTVRARRTPAVIIDFCGRWVGDTSALAHALMVPLDQDCTRHF